MGTQLHIIKKQVLEVELPAVDEAWKIQNRFCELYKQELVPVLEQLFDEICPVNETIRIDKLDIDLGKLTAEQFEEEVRQKLGIYLRDIFTPAVVRARNVGTAVINNSTISKAGSTATTGPEATIKVKQRFSSELALLAHFLQTGTLPWWYDKETYGTPAYILEQSIARGDPFFIGHMEQLAAWPVVRKRLVYTLRTEQLRQLLRLFPAQPAAKYVPLYFELAEKAGRLFTAAPPAELRYRLLEAALIHVLLNDDAPVWQLFEAGGGEFKKVILDESLPASAGISRSTRELFVQLAEALKAKREEEMIPPAVKKPEGDAITIDKDDLADFYINNAGLVLLWPFLQTFFGELGLTKDKKFIDEAAAQHAVHLLQYLATGDDKKHEEHELVLNKLICGLDLTEPLDMNLTISEAEMTECNNLLQAVIDNWKAIGRTSITGFRSTFLQKEGALKKAEKGWNLYIERKTVDMLLDRLPWGFSVVKMPWSKVIIYTEW